MIGIIEGKSGSGKTTELLKLADAKNYIVLTYNEERKHVLQNQCEALGLDLPIYTVNEFKYIKKGDTSIYEGIAIDDFDIFMKMVFKHNLELITLTNNDYPELEYSVVGDDN